MKSLELHQIEITSRCNLSCSYCINPIMSRSKQDMKLETFEKCLNVIKGFNQIEVNLAGTGESLLHPNFVEYIELARHILGSSKKLVLATNGTLLTKKIVEVLKECEVFIWVSIHQIEKSSKGIDLCRKHKLPFMISRGPIDGGIDWAGQIKWPVTATRSPCAWKEFGWFFVASNGDILRCCQDGSGVGKIGTIDDDLSNLKLQRYSLCDKCVWEY